jgi:hypothetical protein
VRVAHPDLSVRGESECHLRGFADCPGLNSPHDGIVRKRRDVTEETHR